MPTFSLMVASSQLQEDQEILAELEKVMSLDYVRFGMQIQPLERVLAYFSLKRDMDLRDKLQESLDRRQPEIEARKQALSFASRLLIAMIENAQAQEAESGTPKVRLGLVN